MDSGIENIFLKWIFLYNVFTVQSKPAKRGTSGPEVGRPVLREVVSYVCS